MDESKSVDTRAFLELRVWADTFAQIQRDRISLSNRLGAGAVPADIVADLVDNYKRSESMVGLAMRRSFRKAAPEVVAWLKTPETVGIGEHLMARLLGTIGHPVVAQPHHWEGDGSERVLVADDPFVRNVGKLWAYCGVGDPSKRRRVGMDASQVAAAGNPRAKMLVRLMAEGCIKCVGSSKMGSISQVRTTTDAVFQPAPGGHAPSLEDTALADPPAGSIVDTHDRLSTDPATVQPAPTGIPAPSDHTALTGASSAGSERGSDTQRSGDPANPQAAPVEGSNSNPFPVPPEDESGGAMDGRKYARRRSPYRDVYDAARIVYASRDWTPGHQHNAALRVVSKEILKDLWVVMR